MEPLSRRDKGRENQFLLGDPKGKNLKFGPDPGIELTLVVW